MTIYELLKKQKTVSFFKVLRPAQDEGGSLWAVHAWEFWIRCNERVCLMWYKAKEFICHRG